MFLILVVTQHICKYKINIPKKQVFTPKLNAAIGVIIVGRAKKLSEYAQRIQKFRIFV